MLSQVSKFGLSMEALALRYEHLENRTWANRSLSRVLAEINGNTLTDQATRSRQKTAHRHAVWDRTEPETRHRGKADLIAHGVTMCRFQRASGVNKSTGKPTCGRTRGSGAKPFPMALGDH